MHIRVAGATVVPQAIAEQRLSHSAGFLGHLQAGGVIRADDDFNRLQPYFSKP
jgi:hypothetical protein